MHTIELQGNQIQVTGVGETFQQENSFYTPIWVVVAGKEYERNIIVDDQDQPNNLEDFCAKNEQQINDNLISLFSETGTYNNRD